MSVAVNSHQPLPACLDISGTRVQIASDLHLDFWLRAGRPVPFEPDITADALVLAGDLCNGPDRFALDWLIALAEPRLWPQGIFVVLGNHDHYGLRLDAAGQAWSFLERDCARLHVLDRRCAGYPLRLRDGRPLRIAGCTLWSDFRHGNPLEMLAWGDTPDSRFIQSGVPRRSVTADDLYAEHHADRAWLESLCPGTEASPLLVVTHHAPSLRSADPRYTYNGAFVSDLDDLVRHLSPVAWVHGHTHAIHDYMIGTSRVIARPIGYPGEAVYHGCVERHADKLE